MDIGPGVAYVCQACAHGGTSTRCILLAHDFPDFRTGRHRQLADAFATQGWLAVLPDFSAAQGPAESAGAEAWRAAVQAFARDFLLPWLEARGVVALQCVGFGVGAVTAALVARSWTGVAQPKLLGTVLAQPTFGRPHVRSQEELQQLLSAVEQPLLILPASRGAVDLQAGGLVVEALHRARGMSADVVEFAGSRPGFMIQGDITRQEVLEALRWAAELSSEFLHRNFAAVDATQLGEQGGGA